jgi:hypothetical protein
MVARNSRGRTSCCLVGLSRGMLARGLDGAPASRPNRSRYLRTAAHTVRAARWGCGRHLDGRDGDKGVTSARRSRPTTAAPVRAYVFVSGAGSYREQTGGSERFDVAQNDAQGAKWERCAANRRRAPIGTAWLALEEFNAKIAIRQLATFRRVQNARPTGQGPGQGTLGMPGASGQGLSQLPGLGTAPGRDARGRAPTSEGDSAQVLYPAHGHHPGHSHPEAPSDAVLVSPERIEFLQPPHLCRGRLRRIEEPEHWQRQARVMPRGRVGQDVTHGDRLRSCHEHRAAAQVGASHPGLPPPLEPPSRAGTPLRGARSARHRRPLNRTLESRLRQRPPPVRPELLDQPPPGTARQAPAGQLARSRGTRPLRTAPADARRPLKPPSAAPRAALEGVHFGAVGFVRTPWRRRRWDLNPRWVAPHTISNRADSAALARLQSCLGGSPKRLPAAHAGPRPRAASLASCRAGVGCGGRVLRNGPS